MPVHLVRSSGSLWVAVIGTVALISAVACSGASATPSATSAATTAPPAASVMASTGPSAVASQATAASASGMPAVSEDPTLRAEVPPQYRSKATLTVATTVFPPFEIFGTNNAIEGADPDLYAALGRVLGLKFSIINTTFASIIPGIQSGRYDLSSPLGDFVERQATVSFVDYSKGGSSALVNAAGSFQPSSVLDLCGHTIGIETGSAETNVTQAISQMCQQAGKPALTVNNYPDVAAASLAVKSGRVDALLTDSAANGYDATQSNGQFVSDGLSGGDAIPGWGATFGIVFQKGSGLGTALLGALQKLVQTGVYQQIYAKWGLQNNTIPLDRMKIDGSTAHQKQS